jgi:hypothetical protein
MGASKKDSDKKKSKVVIRKNRRANGTELNPTTQTEDSGNMEMSIPPMEELMASETTTINDAMAATSQDATPSTAIPPALPPLPGFDMSGVSRVHEYAVRTMLVFADCAVQSTPEAIFDVLARNFADTGALTWWLWRISKRDLAGRIKRRDIIDATRITAHTLHQQLKSEIGGKLPRW